MPITLRDGVKRTLIERWRKPAAVNQGDMVEKIETTNSGYPIRRLAPTTVAKPVIVEWSIPLPKLSFFVAEVSQQL